MDRQGRRRTWTPDSPIREPPPGEETELRAPRCQLRVWPLMTESGVMEVFPTRRR